MANPDEEVERLLKEARKRNARASKNQPKESRHPSLLRYCILIGLAGLFMSVVSFHDWYYFGESLINEPVTIKSPPVYVYGGKHGTNRYEFEVNEYNCDFWLAYGALDIINHDPALKGRIKSIKAGDQIRVMELSKDGVAIVSAAKVSDKDKTSFYWRMGVSVLLVIVGAVAEIRYRFL